MYLKSIAILSAALGAQMALAADTVSPVGKTRAEVVSELTAARVAGELPVSEFGVHPLKANSSSKTRAEVTAELVAARKAGELPLAESSNFGTDAKPTGPGKTRAEVIKELTDYVKSGQRERDRVKQELGGI